MPRDSSPEFGIPHRKLYVSSEAKAAREAENGLIQFDQISHLIKEWKSVLRLDAQVIKDLHHTAIHGIYECAGEFRTGYVGIGASKHVPPKSKDVSSLVDEMCEYANAKQGPDGDAIHVAAYLLWRLNWIHPFFGGNGRTSRAVSYLALCTCFGMELPGTNTIVHQIVERSSDYYAALEAADSAIATDDGAVNVGQMESLVSDMLVTQLEQAI